MYEEDQNRIYEVRLFVEDEPHARIGGWMSRLHLFGVEKPARVYLFGTDGFGRDEFSRMLYGGRISLLAGYLGAGVALLAGGISWNCRRLLREDGCRSHAASGTVSCVALAIPFVRGTRRSTSPY